jgi:hypothetical protein
MATQEIQGELFETKPIVQDSDSFKEFLKMLFRACEKVYSTRVVEESFNEWVIEREIEKELEEEAFWEENDF